MVDSKFVLIVAGGSGTRMNTAIPKQFIEVNAKPILMHTIEVFELYDPAIKIIVVLPATQINYWNELCKKYTFCINHKVVEGGDSRFQSVKNGLELLNENGLVAVHDGVRPLVSVQTIANCFEMAEKLEAAIPVVPLVDSIREIRDNNSVAVDRTRFRLVQTPQVFDIQLLKNAYKQNFSTNFTDDASVVEALGEKIYLVDGNVENIKITTATDLVIAEKLINKPILK